MDISTIGIMSPGDMGHAVGRAVRAQGFTVLTALDGRSARSHALAEQGGLGDAGTLDDLIAQSDMVLSIMPPSAAPGFAEAAAQAMLATGTTPLFVDCNAIAPDTARGIATTIAGAGARFVDGGIIGAPPGKGQPTRLYVSGPDAERVTALAGPDLSIRSLGPEIGRASGLKMCYAALTKGTMTLDTAVLLTAASLGLYDELLAEFATSQPDSLARMERRVPWLAADAERWTGEMEEIAATFAGAGLTPHLHEGAADIFRLLAASALGSETRETADRSRTLQEAIEAFLAVIDRPRDAAQ